MLKAAGGTTGVSGEELEDESYTLLAVSWSDFYGSMLHNGEVFTAADLSTGQVLPVLCFYSFNSQLRRQLFPVNKKSLIIRTCSETWLLPQEADCEHESSPSRIFSTCVRVQIGSIELLAKKKIGGEAPCQLILVAARPWELKWTFVLTNTDGSSDWKRLHTNAIPCRSLCNESG